MEQIASALGLPPHKLTDELLEKPSVLALIGTTTPSPSLPSARVALSVFVRWGTRDLCSVFGSDVLLTCRGFADSSAGSAAQLAEANPSSPQVRYYPTAATASCCYHPVREICLV